MKDFNEFIDSYLSGGNAATASKVDSNANVTQKTLATMEGEMSKSLIIATNRARVKRFMNKDTAEAYDAALRQHLIYTNDESSTKPYCASISLYPFLLEGTRCVGGVSGPPKNLQSFGGGFINFIYQVASNFAGAVATVEFIHYVDYFARKTYGPHYLNTHRKEVIQEIQGIVYSINQPAAARGDQAVFWNISLFDEPYFNSMFGDFFYPDGTKPLWGSVRELQNVFMDWFHEERKKELLTFPVVTSSHLIDKNTKEYIDKFSVECRAADMAKGLSFFVYVSDSVDSLASCCRLRNELADNTFSYSLGAGGVVTGSAQVITLNLHRYLRMVKKWKPDATLEASIKDAVKYIHKFLLAHRDMYAEYIDKGLVPVYTAGVMTLDKQFLTVGLNGIVEAAEFFGLTAGNNPEYKAFLQTILKACSDENKAGREKYGVRFNTEFVPAENLGVKFAKWDKRDGYKSRSDVYNSYFYRPEDDEVSITDKFALFGKEVTQYLDGGSALHLNLAQLLDVSQAKHLYTLAARYGVPYWTFNVLSTCCNQCGYIDPETRAQCKACGSTDIDYATRIIGYLKRIGNFSDARKREAALRIYHRK